MNTERIIEILCKRLVGGHLAADEIRLLEEWIAENPARRQALVDELSDHQSIAEEYRLRSMIDTLRPMEEMTGRLGLRPAETPPQRRRSVWIIASVAAAVVALIIAFGLFMIPRTSDTSAPQIAATEAPAPLRIENLTPGSSRAIVTTPSGDTIHLNSPEESRRMLAGKPSEGPLQIDVPRGGEFVVTLEDSTKVWLNSESRLIYPTHFASDCRRVEIQGEAYFEVARDPHLPFIVESGSQRVKVYGTEFNIRAYPEDESIYTTLAEGSISLTSTAGGGELFLSPGKQAVFNKATSEASVRNIDIERVTSWRHGRFVFEEQSLAQIMRDLSRWYNFEYEFTDRDAAETIFMGSIPRYSNFKTAIIILEKSGGLRIDVHDNKVRISSRK